MVEKAIRCLINMYSQYTDVFDKLLYKNKDSMASKLSRFEDQIPTITQVEYVVFFLNIPYL